MKQLYTFDFVHDTQEIFRKLLHNIANPGQIDDIACYSGKFDHSYAHLLGIGCTLADNETTIYVEKNPAFGQQLMELTLTKNSSLEEADYIFITGLLNKSSLNEILTNGKKGTYVDPHGSVTVVIQCATLQGEKELTLVGPGIKGQLTMLTNQYIIDILEMRAAIPCEYPCGIDLVFVSESGEIISIPRLCQIQ